MSARRECDLFLGKHFNAVPHDINASVIRSIQLQQSIFYSRAKELLGHCYNTGGLSGPWWASKDNVWHIASLRDHPQTTHHIHIAYYIINF